MDKKEFTQAIANRSDLGTWSLAAQNAIDTERFDLYVDHWKEQYEDKGSRQSVIRMLGNDLIDHLENILYP